MKENITLLPTRRSIIEASLVAGTAAVLVSCGSGKDAQELPSSTGAGHDAIATSKLQVSGTASVTVDGEGYLLYRPDETTVLAYTSVCTHQGCAVGTGSGTIFKCPCHGSEYSKLDGSVTQGPASKSLARFVAAIDGDTVKIYL